jgi:hypothetical protein
MAMVRPVLRSLAMEPMRGATRATEITAPVEIADDRVLDETFGRLLAVLEASDFGRIGRLWREFALILEGHMDDEEQRVTPRLAAIHLRDALAILQEHRHLRLRLKEIGDSIAQHAIGESIARRRMRIESARSFRDELRAHAQHEAAIVRGLQDASGEGAKA